MFGGRTRSGFRASALNESIRMKIYIWHTQACIRKEGLGVVNRPPTFIDAQGQRSEKLAIQLKAMKKDKQGL